MRLIERDLERIATPANPLAAARHVDENTAHGRNGLQRRNRTSGRSLFKVAIHNFLRKSFHHSTHRLAANLQKCASRFFLLVCYSQIAMSSYAQILANQHNAERSTGPLSPAGKAASSRNATTHGLCAGFAVLPHEDRKAFEHLHDSYAQTFKPTNEPEVFLVSRMVESRWKLARLQRMEAALFQQMTGQDAHNTDPDAVIVAAMLAGNANAYASLQRYSAAAERSYYKAKRELERERASSAQPAAATVQTIRPVQNEPKPEAPANLSRSIHQFVGKIAKAATGQRLKDQGQIAKHGTAGVEL
jgi:hypothetical protein